MSRAEPLLSSFLPYAPPWLASASLPGQLEPRLRSLLSAGRQTWPDLELPAAVFLRHLAQVLPREPVALLPLLDGLQIGDLYLACACAKGQPQAHRELERRYLLPAARAPTRRGLGAVLDEAVQVVRERLLRPRPDGPPKIAEYAGAGSLRSWIRTAVTRAALTLQVRRNARQGDEHQALARLAATGDLELDYLRSCHRGDFERALRDALAGLSTQQRLLLRLYYVDELNTDAIAPLFQVHRATVSRWVIAAREALRKEAHRLLMKRLRLSQRELDSLMEALRSQLDLSLAGLLRREHHAAPRPPQI